MTDSGNLKKAIIEILDSAAVDPSRGLPARFEVQFNPTQYQIAKTVNYEETKTPGLNLPLLKFVSGEEETLTLELFYDTTEHGMGSDALDVRTHTRSIYQLSQIQPKLHAPPRIRFTWGSLSFVAVASSVSQTFDLFNPDGVPLRATVSVTFKKIAVDEDSSEGQNLQSPDRWRTYTVRHGDTLPGIAHREYDSPKLWRPIADANRAALTDLLRLPAGLELFIPKLDAFGNPVAE